MNGVRKVVLGGADYPLGRFTIAHVSRLAPLLKTAGIGSPQETDTLQTAVHIGLQSGGYAGTYQDFQGIAGVTVGELLGASLEIGRTIGYFKEEDAPPGEALGAASP